jgi:2-oxoglutarate ferredoxin oxidoreductase subunit gamma
MRGGTANCHVIVSDRMVGSPIIHRDASVVVVMNLPSLDKFEADLKEGGVLFVNTSLIKKSPERKDIEVINVSATNIANELGNIRVANVVMLGAYVQKMGTVSMDTVKKIIEEVFANKKELVALNIKALEKGAETIHNS